MNPPDVTVANHILTSWEMMVESSVIHGGNARYTQPRKKSKRFGGSWQSGIGKFDTDRQGADAAPCGNAKALEKGRADTMTMKEKLKVHAEIERKNRENLKTWKEGGKAA